MTVTEQKYHKHYGHLYLVTAEFPDTDAGAREANQHMELTPGVGVLAVIDGRVILAANDDEGIAPLEESEAGCTACCSAS